MNDPDLLNSSNDAPVDLSKYYKCRSCGMQFDNLGDMQRHILVEHMQKGDIRISCSSHIKKLLLFYHYCQILTLIKPKRLWS